MKIAAALILAGLVLAATGPSWAQAQQCPAGIYPSLDAFGNRTCKRVSDGSAASVEVPKGQTCPMGAYPTLDNYGNKVCRSQGAGAQRPTDYYDTSKGCPAGTFPTLDPYGRPVCKGF